MKFCFEINCYLYAFFQASQVVVVLKNLPAGNIRDTSTIPGSGRFPGGGHGNPLQYSCLGNPIVRGAWWAMVHTVARLKQLSTHIRLLYLLHLTRHPLQTPSRSALCPGAVLRKYSSVSGRVPWDGSAPMWLALYSPPLELLMQQGRSAHAGSCGPPWRWHYQELCEVQNV